MQKMKRLIALATVMSMFAASVHGQEYYDEGNCEAEAYCDSGCASYMSAALPIGALAVAAIIIATTNRHHHHHHSSSTTYHATTGTPYSSSSSN